MTKLVKGILVMVAFLGLSTAALAEQRQEPLKRRSFRENCGGYPW